MTQREDVARVLWIAGSTGRTNDDWGLELAASPNALEMQTAFRQADAVLALPNTGQPQEADASMLICAVDAAIEAIDQGSSSAPILELLKAARTQFLGARSALSASPRAEEKNKP